VKSAASSRRYCPCFGGSNSRKLRRAASTSSGKSSIVAAPPSSDENVFGSFNTASTSLYFVNAQKPRPAGSGWK
jgi:hypothetical protein